MQKDQALAFLSQLVDRINAQDNRGTAMPYFYVIRTSKWRVAKDGYTHGNTREVKYDDEMCSEYDHEDEEKYIKYCIEAGYSETREAARDRWNDIETHTLEEYEKEDNVFLTEEGFNEHVRLNGHNLGGRGEYYSYVKHAFRNPELHDLLRAIAAVTGKELGKR